MHRLVCTFTVVLISSFVCALVPAFVLAAGNPHAVIGLAVLSAVVALTVWSSVVYYSSSHLTLRSGAAAGCLTLLVVLIIYSFIFANQPWQISLITIGAGLAYFGIYVMFSGALTACLVKKILRLTTSFEQLPAQVEI